MQSAVLYGVSVGPGDPQLLTLKAVKTVEQAEVIAAARVKDRDSRALSIIRQVCDLSKKSIVLLDFPMSEDNIRCRGNYERVADTLEGYLDAGKSVAFLTLGDISVYSTCSYVLQICQNDGYKVEMIPGVSAFLAAAARWNRPLVQGEESLLITNNRDPRYEELLRLGTNVVVMKTTASVEELQSLLGDSQAYEVMAVSNCGSAQERIYSESGYEQDIEQNNEQETENGQLAKEEPWEYFTTALCCRKRQ